MLRSQEIMLRMSEISTRLDEIQAVDETTPELRAEMDTLTTEYRDAQTNYRAAVVKEDQEREELQTRNANGGGWDWSQETREFVALQERAQTSRYITAALNGSPIAGAELELNQALGIPGSALPLSQLLPLDTREPERPLEERADVLTAPTVTSQQMARPWVDRVFADTSAAFLGLPFASADSGDQAVPQITAGAAGATVAAGAAQDAEAATIGVTTLTPHRLSARYQFRLEDTIRLPMLEEALRRDMAMALAETMDMEIIQGGTGITDLDSQVGTGKQIDIADVDADISSAAEWKTMSTSLLGATVLDGRYATMNAEVAWLLNTMIYGAVQTAFRTATSDVSLDDWLTNHQVRHRSSIHLPQAPTGGSSGDAETVAFASLARGLAQAATIINWPAVELIRDPYTDASKGLVALTLVNMWDYKILRQANFAKIVATKA